MSPRLPFSDMRLMSLSAQEFEASIRKLGCHRMSASGFPVFDLGGGSVEIRYEAAPPKTFGGLLSLPQAHVTLVFERAGDGERAAFVHRFDIAFQRGGG
jgi:hypothetical protein